MKFDVDSEVPDSQCCECGYGLDRVTGPTVPKEGDFSLCINCGSLNIFNADLTLRQPNDEEIFSAAKDSDIQSARKAILIVKACRGSVEKEGNGNG